MGDPAGVGPEVIIKVFQDQSIFNFVRPLVVGDANFLNEMASFQEAGVSDKA